jgi:hypothetical protein
VLLLQGHHSLLLLLLVAAVVLLLLRRMVGCRCQDNQQPNKVNGMDLGLAEQLLVCENNSKGKTPSAGKKMPHIMRGCKLGTATAVTALCNI